MQLLQLLHVRDSNQISVLGGYGISKGGGGEVYPGGSVYPDGVWYVQRRGGGRVYLGRWGMSIIHVMYLPPTPSWADKRL